MKKIIIFILLIIPLYSIKAQSFEKGDQVFNLGIGIGGAYNSGYSIMIPPISASFEYGLTNDLGIGNFGVGLYAGISSVKDNFETHFTPIVIGIRAAYHFYKTEKVDIYAGALLGFRMVESDNIGMSTYSAKSGIAWDTFVGARYYWTPSLTVMTELGYGISWLTVGIAYKL